MKKTNRPEAAIKLVTSKLILPLKLFVKTNYLLKNRGCVHVARARNVGDVADVQEVTRRSAVDVPCQNLDVDEGNTRILGLDRDHSALVIGIDTEGTETGHDHARADQNGISPDLVRDRALTEVIVKEEAQDGLVKDLTVIMITKKESLKKI